MMNFIHDFLFDAGTFEMCLLIGGVTYSFIFLGRKLSRLIELGEL